VGRVAWHQYFGGKNEQWKIGGKNWIKWINDNNIFHTIPIM
jgi:hypothetical protein